MSDELDEIVDNISERSFWVRILLMVGFALVLYIVILPLILVLTIAQALFTLITGQSNANLRYFSATLALYVPQVIEFLTYLSDVRPYPFSDLPEVDDDSLEGESTKSSAKKPESKSASKKTNGAAKDETKAATASTAEKKPLAAKKKAPKKKTAVKKKVAVKKKAAKKAPKPAEKPKEGGGSEAASDS